MGSLRRRQRGVVWPGKVKASVVPRSSTLTPGKSRGAAVTFWPRPTPGWAVWSPERRPPTLALGSPRPRPSPRWWALGVGLQPVGSLPLPRPPATPGPSGCLLYLCWSSVSIFLSSCPICSPCFPLFFILILFFFFFLNRVTKRPRCALGGPRLWAVSSENKQTCGQGAYWVLNPSVPTFLCSLSTRALPCLLGTGCSSLYLSWLYLKEFSLGPMVGKKSLLLSITKLQLKWQSYLEGH